ncbi:hypothetical protein A7978_04930 (plasmid) [Borrelia turicatae]|uniref:Lipoprotein n=2 Tax=Borrelia turicatae TaxID=142 RepID=A0A0R9P6L3_BORT9|nr:hypothetical protein [Borrelia turicatae]ALC78607.1 hypothetical protein BTA120 [Borrelia turicatae 91E135]ANF34455.1 hypothetical protein A7978_04930 [Borrelia turicatae]UPA14044.1 hypothetical protein bt91E135_001210 [Borrelia turicatae 91E135]UPA15535.1 hypothetical protein btBTE5EL_001220 [Borrelia turicatae]
MLKIKCFSLLLVLILLLLLVISCDSGSKAGAGTNTVTDTGKTTGTNTGTNTGTDTEAEVGDEEALAYLEDISDSKLKELLDQFGVSGAGRKAIGYIQEKLSVSYVDEFDDKFYNYLNKLGADVVIEKIIKPTVSLLIARGKALRVIQGITDADVKTRLQDMLSSCDYVVSFTWYVNFNPLIFKEDVFTRIITRYTSKFRKFKEMVKNPRVMDVYVWLDADEQAAIDEIEKIVVNATYDKEKFNDKLNSLSDYRVAKIVCYYRDFKNDQEEALKAIEGVSDDAEKQNLKTRFNTLQGEYYSHIRDAFNKSADDLYSQLNRYPDEYSSGFSEIKEDAKKAAAAAAAAERAKEAKEAAVAAEAEESTEAGEAEESTEAGEPREGSGTDEESGAADGGS